MPAARFAKMVDTIEPAIVPETARWGPQSGTVYTRDEVWLPRMNTVLIEFLSTRHVSFLNEMREAGVYRDRPGDVDGNDVVDKDDVHRLCVALGEQQDDYRFDVDGDQQVNAADLRYLVQELLATNYGDANLDGVFNSSDLVSIFQADLFERQVASASWETGDWNCDGRFTTQDLVLAFTESSYVE